MAYAKSTIIAVTATSQQYTESFDIRLCNGFCANFQQNAVTVQNVQVTQTYIENNLTQTTAYFTMTGQIVYTPVGCQSSKIVPFTVNLAPITFIGTSGQQPSIAPTLLAPVVNNVVVCNNLVRQINIAIPVTFTATYPA